MTILILCATGKTSTRVISLLRSEYPLLLASRTARSIHGAPGVAFDWDVPEEWNNIFEHEQARACPITTVYLVMRGQTVDFSASGIPFVDLCIAHGVKRFVQLSGSALDHMGKFYENISVCRTLKGIEYIVLRPSWFMENFSEEEHLATIQQADCFYTAAGGGKLPLVSCDDVARVAYHVLTAQNVFKHEYLVCGPENLTYNDCARILSEVTGREIRHVEITPQQLKAALLEASSDQMPADYAQLLADLDALVADGKEELCDASVETLTGRKPVSFREFCQEHKHLWIKFVARFKRAYGKGADDLCSSKSFHRVWHSAPYTDCHHQPWSESC